MGKVIIKTALKTLLILILVALAAFAVASFGFPQHMATFFENTENYTIAIKYASLRYSYTGDVGDLARCAEDAILSDNDGYIIEYCSSLVKHGDYESYCGQMDEYYSTGDYSSYTQDYNQYIYGEYVTALASSGETQEAVEIALSANGLHGFGRGNALATLALWAAGNGDSETCSLIVDAMLEITIPESDMEYFTSIIQIVLDVAE